MIQPGDMFFIPDFPYHGSIFDAKGRPVIVIRAERDGIFFHIAPITGDNLTGLCDGKWILKDSDNGKKMNLKKDSFILLDNRVMKVSSIVLTDYWGHCSCIEELLQLWKGPSEKKR